MDNKQPRRQGSDVEDIKTEEIWTLLNRARNMVRAGHLASAEPLCKLLVRKHPMHSEAHCLLAQVYGGSGRLTEAVQQLRQAISVNPEDIEPYKSLGLIYLDHDDAAAAACHYFQQAIKLRPDLAELYFLSGLALRRAARPDEAIDAYRKAVTLRPDFADAHNNVGLILSGIGRNQEAAEHYRQILAAHPEYIDAYHGLGFCLHALGDLDQAVVCYEQGLALDPSHLGIWNNIATLYLAQNRLQEALAAFKKSAKLKHDHGRPLTGPRYVFLHRIRHDAEQLRYLEMKTAIAECYSDYGVALTQLESQYAGKSGTDKVPVDALTAQRIAPSFNRIIHCAECAEVAGGALNPELDWSACDSMYRTSRPEMAVIDNFLRPEAYQSLHRFCLESTVWKTVRPYGYLGTLIAEGFASPLLLQIITELREKLPGILGPHHLAQAWAYKYDSSLRAINIHADCAAVNINFWITPEEANKNPNNGGLVIWDVLPPADWGLMRTQNPDKTEINEFLETSGARQIKIPYRHNRVVLFNSALFHKSDETEFHDGYENRRINVTLLYGNGLS